MSNKLIVTIILLLVALGSFFLVFDKENLNTITKTFDKSGQKIELTVNFYNTEKELEAALLKRLGKPFEEYLKLKKENSVNSKNKITLHGQAIFSPDDNICEVFSIIPKQIDDNNTITLGHEILHCIYGSYHSETIK